MFVSFFVYLTINRNRIALKKVFVSYAWHEEDVKTEDLQSRLKVLRDDILLVCHVVWLDLFKKDTGKNKNC
jgi:hypothetical protein